MHFYTLAEDEAPVDFMEKHCDKVKFRQESFCYTAGYLGPSAAADERWVNELFDRLTSC